MTFIKTLRPYQEAASALIVNRQRALLALDLGTGKTIVSIHAIEELRDGGILDCALLIMSSSLTYQWADRIKEFTDIPHEKIVVIDGSLTPTKRKKAYEEALRDRPAYVIMGIRQVVTDIDFVKKLKPDLALVDEVTSIKNFKPQQSKVIKKYVTAPYRVGLTAEPIENGKAEELYSIMQWIDPSLYGSWQDFEDTYIIRNSYNIITGYRNVDEMNKILMTACVNKRRDDKDVATFMPTVEEYDIYVEMDNATRDIYEQIAQDLLRELRNSGQRAVLDLAGYYSGGGEAGEDPSAGRAASRLTVLHLLTDSPCLLEASARAYNDPTDPRGSAYAAQLLEAGRLPSEPLLGAKIEACVELVDEYLSSNPAHKVIVFARFKGVLPILAKQLDKYGSVLFTGDLNGKQRAEAIQSFGSDPSTRIFLSSDAGGYGVDLYMASHLINFDLPLSSGAFKQRNGRHVRASSTFRNVFIDNLIVAGSVEEYQKQRLAYKARVANAALTGRMSEQGGRVTNDVQSLTKFLEKQLENR
jgi:SNF2 family DNA or RNA helicase